MFNINSHREITKYFILSMFLLLPLAAESDDEYRCLQINPKDEPIYCVSIIRLISDPHTFNGKLVMVEGYAHFAFEDSGVYLNKDDYDNHFYRNGIWVNATKSQAKTIVINM